MVVAGLLGACTGLEPSAVSAGASVAQTGVTIFDRGKARTVELAEFDDVVDAARRAAARLSLTRTLEDATPGRLRLAFEDDRGDSIVVVVERHTRTMTLIQADVGALGEIGFASLMVKQILAELTNKGALPPPPKPPAGQKPPPDPVVPPPATPGSTPADSGSHGRLADP
jgi:hypothetical protein